VKNKIGVPALLCFMLLPGSLNAAPIVDFDGRNKEPESATTLLKNTAIESVFTSSKEIILPYRTGTAPRLMMEFGTRSDSGEWLTAQSAWTKDTVSTSTVPGSKLPLDFFCDSNTHSYWSFSVSFINEPFKKNITSPGHSHTKGMPSLTYENGDPVPNPLIVSNIPPGAHRKYTLQMPLFATQIQMFMKGGAGACVNLEMSGHVNVKEKMKMSSMPDGDNSAGYRLVPAPTGSSHPSIHNVTDDFTTALTKLGATWRAICLRSEVLRYQRMSLPWGGVFDRDLNWKEPYFGHDKGAAVDISKRNICKGNRQGFINMLCKDFKVYSEQDNDPSHYHVVSRKEGGNVNWSGAVPCCMQESGQDPSLPACIDLAQGNELYPVTDGCTGLPEHQDPISALK